MDDMIIQTKDLCHLYPNGDGELIRALDKVNVTIRRGEFVVIIGTNGSGKSTLAKHFNALLLPSAGQCLVDGLPVSDKSDLWAIRQKVGMVFQNPDNQIVAAIVEEDVAFGPENLGVPPQEIRQRVDAALAAVDMTDYRLHAPHLLSGGQKQRIAIAGVLAIRPACLVLDEPTAMLDPLGREEVLTTVSRLNKEQGMTVVYITHFMEEAVFADRVIVMEKGRIIREGTPKEIFSCVEEIAALGLEAPLAAEVAWHLRGRGLDLPADIITDEELALALCQSN